MEHLPFFVYGTLKRGGVREQCWPFPPRRVDPAFTRGVLYDLGPYPALADGADSVQGELWQIDAKHLARTIDELDQVEGYRGAADDLYVRRVITVTLADGTAHRAYAYFLADVSTLKESQRVRPN